MKNFIGCLAIVGLCASGSFGQTKSKPKPAPAKPAAVKTTIARSAAAKKPAADPAPAKAVPAAKPLLGETTGQTYRNERLRFEITFPENWTVADRGFETEMKKKGFDLSLKAPAFVDGQTRAKLDRALKNVTVLVTAHRASMGSGDSAIMRVSIEDLTSNPQIKDAVDYFDAVRSQYKAMTLPKDFTYSETRAERLGAKQFGFLDSSSNAGKKRLYATVRNGYAIIFSLSYTLDDDLQMMRQILSEGDFALK